MADELFSLKENMTWDLVDLPADRKSIKTMWIYKTKRADDGSVVRHKVRLVAKGCAQKYGVNYTETYSPVVRYTYEGYEMRKNVYWSHYSTREWWHLDWTSNICQGDLEIADSKSVVTPTDMSQKLLTTMVADGEELTDVPHQEAISSLLYLVQGSRLAFAVSNVSRFNTRHGTAY